MSGAGKTCPHCGAVLPAEASFCPVCSRGLTQRQTFTPPRYRSHQQRQRVRLAVLLPLAAVAAALLIGLGLYLYRASLPKTVEGVGTLTYTDQDGTYELMLNGSVADAPGGGMYMGNLRQYITFTDAEVGNLRPGDVIPTSRYTYTPTGYGDPYSKDYRYEDIVVESASYTADGNYVNVNDYQAVLAKGDDGLWYLEDGSGAYYAVPGEAVVVYIPSGCPISDWSSGYEQSRDHLWEVPDWALEYGGEYKIENGAVTDISIFYHP